ncbi:MAG TPA: choice-of-anchor tandem repeat GloVer-containing protein [Rhizomicrobium sp.]|jgi:uncharacterized repeat protein (TIGR03803 family)
MRHRISELSSLLLACGVAASLAGVAHAAGDFRVLHSSCGRAGCTDGAVSTGGVILADDGSLLGPGDGGKNGRGVLFGLTANAHDSDTVYKRLHNFCGATCNDGGTPDFPLIRDVAGNVYGTTAQGGTGNGGTIFEASPDGKVNTLHAFCSDCGPGFAPSSSVTYEGAASGRTYDGASPLYGTTSQGGSLNGGTVYAFTRQDGKARVKALYNFCSNLPCEEGAFPLGELTVDSAGNIFGVADLGGAHDEGAVFELSPAGTKYIYTVIYSFCSVEGCTDGARPSAGVAIDASGNLFGATFNKGEHDAGTVFELSPNGGGYGFQVLYQFCSEANCTGGGLPEGPLAIDASGNLFGTATQFGSKSGRGTVFELSHGDSGWTQSVLHSFCAKAGCADGAIPFSPLALDANGDLFGTTSAGGASNTGVVFEIPR